MSDLGKDDDAQRRDFEREVYKKCDEEEDRKEYRHKEAFTVMQYQCDTCGKVEKLWNSRDGVTPFMVTCSRCSNTMKHINFHQDKCRPDYLPDVGMRVFVDITPQISEVLVRAQVGMRWDKGKYQMKDRWDKPEDAIKALTESHGKKDKGQPYVITIK